MQQQFFGPEEYRELFLKAEETKELEEEEKANVDKRKTVLQKLLSADKDIVARYKIEVMLNKRTNSGRAFPGVLVIWLSGSALSGGGDEILYPCPNDSCSGVLGSDDIASMTQTAYCRKCKKVWRQQDLSEIRAFNLPNELWADVITKEFIKLEHNADIYLKTLFGETSQNEVLDTTEGKEGGYVAEAMYKGRRKSAVLYSLKDIVRDSCGGSSIESKVLSLLKA